MCIRDSTIVRGIEAQIRDIEELADELDTLRSRVKGENIEARKQSLTDRIETLEAERDTLTASIPAEWEEANATHVALQKTENKARLDYRRAADQAYKEAQTLAATLKATDALRALGSAIPDMKTLMATNEPADLVEPLSQLAREFGEVEGASDIRSAISKAASAMKKKTPKPDDALEAINAAQETYDSEMQWRDAAEKAIGSTLYEYEEQLSLIHI